MLFADEVPTNRLLLIECTRVVAERDSNYIVFHSLFGRRVEAIRCSRALALEMAEMFDINVDIMINDNGFLFTTEEPLKLTQKDMREHDR